MSWPYPGDGPAARARRVAHAYRAALETQAPDACRTLDEQMRRFGQQWVVPDVLIIDDEDEWLPPSRAADLACVEADAIRQMRRRGVLKGRRDPAGNWQYRAGDIVDVFLRPRGRTRGVTDTLHASGSSVPADEHE